MRRLLRLCTLPDQGEGYAPFLVRAWGVETDASMHDCAGIFFRTIKQFRISSRGSQQPNIPGI